MVNECLRIATCTGNFIKLVKSVYSRHVTALTGTSERYSNSFTKRAKLRQEPRAPTARDALHPLGLFLSRNEMDADFCSGSGGRFY